MAFHKIDQDSENSITTALDFFTVPSTNTSVQSSSWREYLPLNPITDVPYHFKIHSSNNYLDLSKAFLLSEMRIRKLNAANNWVALENTDDVAASDGSGPITAEASLRYVPLLWLKISGAWSARMLSCLPAFGRQASSV